MRRFYEKGFLFAIPVLRKFHCDQLCIFRFLSHILSKRMMKEAFKTRTVRAALNLSLIHKNLTVNWSESFLQNESKTVIMALTVLKSKLIRSARFSYGLCWFWDFHQTEINWNWWIFFDRTLKQFLLHRLVKLSMISNEVKCRQTMIDFLWMESRAQLFFGMTNCARWLNDVLILTFISPGQFLFSVMDDLTNRRL